MKKLALASASFFLVCLLAAGVWAQNLYKPLSRDHSVRGVSQAWAGNLDDDDRPEARLWNPNTVDHLAAIFFYNRSSHRTASGEVLINDVTEQFLCCDVILLTPHGAYDTDSILSGTRCEIEDNNTKLYAEVISVPVDPVTPSGQSPTRVADGLGIVAKAEATGENMYPFHPSSFTLPEDDKFPGQRQAAIDCACLKLTAVALANPGKTIALASFSEFTQGGFTCPPQE